TTIYVFNIFKKGYNNNFLNQVKSRLDADLDYDWRKCIQFIDFSTAFEDNHYFDLDVHINEKGHQLVADSLFHRIENEPKGPRTKLYTYTTDRTAAEIQFKGLLKDGMTTYYWENGAISQTTTYKEGIKHSVETNFDSTGHVLSKVYYLNGKQIPHPE
ncbi:MAG: hypothetical protein AAFV80_14990, partial [Bacteroidota bacterium]